ncbi:MAG: hypothetical protein U9Q84_08385 [Thermodesulfobacteriota bacterium]|nr:hypothetical protein [Thermodesulfobacteriota bacterium]
MKTRQILAGLVFLALLLAFTGVPNAFAATLTINTDAQMDKLDVENGATVDVNAKTLTVGTGGIDIKTDGTLLGDGTINDAGGWTLNGTFTHESGTVMFNGAEAQAITNTTAFYDLTINNGAGTPSATVDVETTEAVTVANMLSITDGWFSPHTGSVFKDVSVANAGYLVPGENITVSGNWTTNGTFTAGTGTVTFNGTSTVTTGGTGAGQAFYNVTLAGTSVTLDTNAIKIGGALTINEGNTFALAGNNCDAASISNSGTFQMNGDETLATTTAITGGLVKFVDPAGCTLSTSISGLPDVEFNSTGKTFTLSEDMTYITGNITVAVGTLTMDGFDMTLADGKTVTNNGTWSVPTSGSLFTCAGSATFAGGSINFYDFTRNPAAGATLTFTDGVTYTVKGVLTLKGAGSGADILNIVKSGGGANAVLSKDGTSSVEYVAVNGVNGVVGKIITASSSYAAGGAPLYWQFGTGTAAEGGNWNTAATWASGHVPDSADDVTISENVTLDTDTTVNSLNVSSNTLSFDGTTAHTLGVTGSVTVGGTLDVGIGALTATGASTITGTLSISTGTYTANDSFDASGGGTVTFTGAGTLKLAGAVACGGLGTFTKATGCIVDYKLDGTQSVNAVDYYYLKLSGGGTKTLCGSIDVDGTLTVNDSDVTFDVADSAYSINIAGNWSNSGTFSNANGTVTFDGTAGQTITCGASSPFYNLTINNSANAADITLADNLDVDGKLLLTDGDLNFGASKEHHFAADFEIQSAGSITKGTGATFIVFDGTTTLTDNSSGGPQNLGHVKVVMPMY